MCNSNDHTKSCQWFSALLAEAREKSENDQSKTGSSDHLLDANKGDEDAA